MSYCPKCGTEVYSIIEKEKLDYGDEFNCSFCNIRLEFQYDEIWDGVEESSYSYVTEVK